MILITIVVLFILALLYYTFFSSSSQLLGKVHHSFSTDKKEIALTFDDGPNEPYTSELLAVLRKHHIKATFFCCGACISKYPTTIEKIYKDGHIIGNHSHDHNLLHYLSTKKYLEEIKTTNRLIESITGTQPTLYRSPWLFRTSGLLRAIHDMKMSPIWGTFGSELEVFQPNPESMVSRAKSLTKPGTILIFHDGRESRGGNRKNSVKAIDLLIPYLISEGYSFVKVTESLIHK